MTVRMGKNRERRMRRAKEEMETIAWLKAQGFLLVRTEEGVFTHVLKKKKEEELSKSKQKMQREELEAIAWLEAEGVLLNDFINSEVLTRIMANGGEVEKPDRINCKVLKAESKHKYELSAPTKRRRRGQGV